jgi:hypothetical protein
MNTVGNKKKLRASAIGAAAAVSLPTLLFAGAGTAQAETNLTYFANQMAPNADHGLRKVATPRRTPQ